MVKGPVKANIFVPTPNHSHVVIRPDIDVKAIWWQVIPILVLMQADWPRSWRQWTDLVRGDSGGDQGRTSRRSSVELLFVLQFDGAVGGSCADEYAVVVYGEKRKGPAGYPPGLFF